MSTKQPAKSQPVQREISPLLASLGVIESEVVASGGLLSAPVARSCVWPSRPPEPLQG